MYSILWRHGDMAAGRPGPGPVQARTRPGPAEAAGKAEIIPVRGPPAGLAKAGLCRYKRAPVSGVPAGRAAEFALKITPYLSEVMKCPS